MNIFYNIYEVLATFYRYNVVIFTIKNLPVAGDILTLFYVYLRAFGFVVMRLSSVSEATT